MGKVRRKTTGNVLYLFPMHDETSVEEVSFNQELQENLKEEDQFHHKRLPSLAIGGIDELDVVICGTFRKDVEGLRRLFEQLKDLGFNVLSPLSVDIATEEKGLRLHAWRGG